MDDLIDCRGGPNPRFVNETDTHVFVNPIFVPVEKGERTPILWLGMGHCDGKTAFRAVDAIRIHPRQVNHSHA